MASGGHPPNLWDADHKDGKELVISHETYHRLLMDNFMVLLGKLQFSKRFLIHLLDRGVVDEIIKTKIAGLQTREAQVLKLVDHIVNSEVYKFHGFAWAIVNSQQYEVAMELGFHLTVYLDESQFLKTSSFICQACWEYNTKAYILPECGHFVCSPCIKGAQFTCKDNKKEDITCPIDECGKISESHPNSESAIGLKEDATYAALCKLVQGQAQVDKGCKDTRKTTKTNWNEVLNAALIKKAAEISTYEQKYRSYTDTIAKSDQILKNYVDETRRKIIKWVEDWHTEQESFIHNAKIQVQTHHAEGVQWEKVIRDLTIMSNVYPWKLENIASELAKTDLPKLDGALPAVVCYLEQRLSGTAIPKKILIPRLLDTHATAGLPLTIDTANLILKWKSPWVEVIPPLTVRWEPPDGYISDLDWTLEGHIILSTNPPQFIRLTLDLASGSVVENHKLDKIRANSVSATKDGKIYLGDDEVVMIYDPGVMDFETWQISKPPNDVKVQHLSVSGNSKYVVLSTGRNIAIYDQQKFRREINMPSLKKSCICRNTLVVAARGVHIINLETVKQIQLPSVNPTDVAPFGDDYFLLYDKDVFKVFSLTGKFIHALTMDIEKSHCKKIHCRNNVSIATFPKEGSPTHLAVACCSEIWVYSLT